MDNKKKCRMALLGRPELVVFLAGFSGLFIELALIRWVSCEIRVFAYIKNLILIACFLGFGLGCFKHKSPINFVNSFFLVLILSLFVILPLSALGQYSPKGITTIFAKLPGIMIFHHPEEKVYLWNLYDYLKLFVAIFWTSSIFFIITCIMIPYGQLTGKGINECSSVLKGYSASVAGSLMGIFSYTFMTFLNFSPFFWFIPVLLLSSLLAEQEQRKSLLAISVALFLILLPTETRNSITFWSSYQKLTWFKEANGESNILVNNVGYQRSTTQTKISQSSDISRHNMGYAFEKENASVLIVGAGTGNDAAAAIINGASSVNAVEIDPTIYWIGKMTHPQEPYSNKNVKVTIDDARHFFKTTKEKFDIIVFSHLDSHGMLSSYTNVRLDNYIYTTEAFKEARTLLKPEGLIYVSFYVEKDFIGHRLYKNLEIAFGYPPLVLEEIGARFKGTELLNFIISEKNTLEKIKSQTMTWKNFKNVDYRAVQVVPSYDDWPFLHLEKPSIPVLMRITLIAIVIMTSIFISKQYRLSLNSFEGKFFWLGAAFMLLEVHNVSKLALVFGTTWKVNAWVISMIMGIILFANFLCICLKNQMKILRNVSIVGLFLVLMAVYFLPLRQFGAFSNILGGFLLTFIVCLPFFFAAIIFAYEFSESSSPSNALGWNIMGSMLGGLMENVSYIWGISSMLLLAMIFYAIAIWGGSLKKFYSK